MVLTGVVCEYNPFHNGHALQLGAARSLSGPDAALVCVMGGNFVQRGEPAIVSKHARAEMAALCGADLVLELPVPWALASAERFAAGGVALLDAVGADFISFGAECPDAGRLRTVADALLTPECDAFVKIELSSGISYAAARERAVRRFVGEDALLLREPNNILAVEYLKAIARRRSPLRPLPVPRAFAAHDGGERGVYAGASRVRELIASGGDYGPLLPDPALSVLRRELIAGRTPDRNRLDAMTMYRLRTMTPEEYAALPDSGEGLWARLKRCAGRESTLTAVLDGAKTKRYAHARLRRMAMAALLGVTAERQRSEPPYLRVLAVGPRGREALREIKGRAALPVITKPASVRTLPPPAREVFELESRAADIFALLCAKPQPAGVEWTASPFVIS